MARLRLFSKITITEIISKVLEEITARAILLTCILNLKKGLLIQAYLPSKSSTSSKGVFYTTKKKELSFFISSWSLLAWS